MFYSLTRETVEWAGIRQVFHMRAGFGPQRLIRPQGLLRSPFNLDRPWRCRTNQRGSGTARVAASRPAGAAQPALPRGRLTGRGRRRQEAARWRQPCLHRSDGRFLSGAVPPPCRPAGIEPFLPELHTVPVGNPRRHLTLAELHGGPGGPPHGFALPRRAHRRRLVANGPATLNKGPAKGS